jgi:hypothetical protein
MAKARIINKQVPMSMFDIIRYQINMHCFSNKIRLSPAQQDCLALLGLYGEMFISDFCEETVNKEIFGNVQTARNFMVKCIKDDLVVRSGMGNKVISLNKNLEILTDGTILLNLKVYHHATNESN